MSDTAIEALRYSEFPNSSDCISRQAAIDALDKHLQTTDVPVSYPGIISALTEWLNEVPSAQPDYQEVLGWLLAYHTKSFDLRGRYMANEVIGWLVHDFASAYMAERQEKE